MSHPTLRHPNCSYCGTQSSPGESFCRNCGKPVVAATAGSTEGSTYATAPLSPRSQAAPVVPPFPAPIKVGRKRRSRLLLGCLILIGLSLIALGAGAVYVWHRASYTSPGRTTPAFPARAALTFTEFPVDDDPEAPGIPTSVEAEALDVTTTPKFDYSSSTRLPPGITRSLISEGANSLTSATYQQRAQSPTANPSANETVYVCVLTLMAKARGFTDSLSEAVVNETSGDKASARIQSDTGFVYVGSKITSPKGIVYLLNKQGADILILIFSSDTANSTFIDRLAQKVGNAQGLLDYAEVKEPLWNLPSEVPAGLTLVEVKTMSGAQIEDWIVSASQNEDAQRVVSQMRSLIPNRLTAARYIDSNRVEWMALSFEYNSTFQAWRNWLLTRVALGLAGATKKIVRNVVALYLNEEGVSVLVFHKGPYIVLLTGPDSAGSDRMVGLGNLFQV